MSELGKLLILAGVLLVALGALFILGPQIAERFPWLRIGRLPGDMVYRGEKVTVFFPIVTGLILSLLLGAGSWLLNWLLALFRK